MKHEIESEKVKDFFQIISDLENLLDERIVDLHEVRGGMQARHAYCYYRKLLWEAKYIIRDNLKEVNDKVN
jgi:hypothetical protein